MQVMGVLSWWGKQKRRLAIMYIALADTAPPLWDLLAGLQTLFHYHFMQNAYLAGTLVALAAGVIGYFMVLRDQSFAGHSLANVGFAGATGALLFGITPVVGLFLAGLLAAVGMQTLNVAAGQNRQSDIAVGAVFTASLALGFLFIHLSTAEYAANVYNVLFGNVLGISDMDVAVIAWSTLLLLVVLFFIARPLFFASIDPDVAAAHGVPVRALAFGYLVLLALEVAVAVQVVGVLLIFALLVTPAAIAQSITTRPILAVLVAIALALLFTWAGLAVGYVTPYPVGFFITTFAFGTYVLVRGGRFVRASLVRRLPRAQVGGTI
jgi:zinc/manganese transport system permease protein